MEFENKTIEELVQKFIDKPLLGKNKKTIKGQKLGWQTFGLSLIPWKYAGGHNLCPSATEDCIKTCIVKSGNARFKPVNQSRYDKTRLFLKNRGVFIDILTSELIKQNALAKALGFKVAIRLNVFSDIPFHKFINFEDYEYLQFYDYTKIPSKMMQFLTGKLPKNYHLTFSYSGENWDVCEAVLNLGGNVAIVFDQLPEKYKGFEVINGDETDLTFLYGKGQIVGLKYKKATGKGADNDISNSKFVIKTKN